MKKLFFLLAFLPLAIFAQTKTSSAKNFVTQPADEFNISGSISGYPDNTEIFLLNPNTGAPEASAKIVGGKFNMNGKISSPDFRLLSINSQPPYLSIFLDNSNITLDAKKETFESTEIKGSSSHNDFVKFNAISKPYEQLFSQADGVEQSIKEKAATEFNAFIISHPSSYITPLAIYRHYQMLADNDKLEQQYNLLPNDIQKASIGAYLSTLIAENKKFPLGKPFTNFTQADKDGKPVSLASFKGKYVLIDFWASWCGPCRQENPNIVATYHKYKDKNFTVLGVSLDKTKEPWLQAIQQDGLAWTHVSDLKGWNNEVAQQFGIFSIPQSFLIDPNGNLVGKNLRGPALEAKLAELIK